MASSDSFFMNGLTSLSTAEHLLFVGHLSEEESRLYWESVLFNPKNFEGFPMLSFQEAYKYSGGCMHLMGESYRLHCHSRGKIEPRFMHEPCCLKKA